MAGDMKRYQWDVADHQRVAIVEQAIELRPVAGELGAFIEDFSKDAQHRDDLASDP